MLVYLSKDRFGLRYRTDTWSAWNYLPDNNHTIEGVKDFFTQGGKYDKPSFVVTDEKGEKAVYYSIEGNNAFVNFDPKYNVLLQDADFVPPDEQIEFLKQFSDTDTDQDALKINSPWQKLQLYKQKAEAGELYGLKELIKERKTPEKIIEFCTNHAEKFYQSKAVIEFKK